MLEGLVARVRPGDAVYVYELGHPQFEWYSRHGAPMPAGVEIVRAAATPEAIAPVGAGVRFSSPISLDEALAKRADRPARTRVWALFTHVVTWKGTDEERLARLAFERAGFTEDGAASAGLEARGARAVLFVRQPESPTSPSR